MAERVAVTGAAGFVGANLVRALLARGDRVTAVVAPSTDPWRLEALAAEIELVRRDARELAADALSGSDVVLHLAAAGVRPDADLVAVVEANVLGTLAALEASRAAGCRRFVYCGSCFEYGPGEGHRETDLPRPLAEYGASKAAGWLLAHAFGTRHGVDVVSVRPFTVYGPLEAAYRLVPSTLLAALAGGPVEVTGGAQTRDLLWVGDAVTGLLAAADTPAAAGGTFNLCTGTAVSVLEVAELATEIAGTGAEVLAGALPPRAVEHDTLSGDPTLAADVLGWRAATSLREGMELTAAWLSEHRELHREYAAAGARR